MSDKITALDEGAERVACLLEEIATRVRVGGCAGFSLVVLIDDAPELLFSANSTSSLAELSGWVGVAGAEIQGRLLCVQEDV